MNKTKIYTDHNVKTDIIINLKIGIIGFGNQGKAQALNLKDSGINVVIGLRKGSLNKKNAIDQGFKVYSIEEVVTKCDIICLLIPDEQIGAVYRKDIKKYLEKGKSLLFSHGYSVHFKHINIPIYVDVILVAPNGSGRKVRSEFLKGSGVPNLVAINQDYSGNALELALAYSKSIGGTKLGVFLTTFKEETITDIFGEQILLTGSIPKLMKESFNVLVENNYSPEVAWLVCYYEVKSIIDSFYEEGFDHLNKIVSNIAEYGGLTRGKRLVNSGLKKKMKEILNEIEDGRFEKEWKKEKEYNYKTLKEERKVTKNSKIEKTTLKMTKLFFKDNN